MSEKIVTVPNPLASQVFLSSSLNPAPKGTGVTFTATVVVAGPFGQIATGSVNFLDGVAVIGSGTLNGLGIARFTTTSLAVGSHPITASYGGDAASGGGTHPAMARGARQARANTSVSAGTLPSVSSVLAELITASLTPEPVSFTLTVTPTPVTVGVGRTAVLLVTVTPVSGFLQPVQLSCAGAPFESACTFVQGTIPAGGGSTTLDVSTMAPHNCGDPGHPYFLGEAGRGPLGGGSIPLAASLVGGLGVLLLPKRRRWMRVVLVVAALGGIAAVTGCGACTDLGTRPGTYTFTVSGAAQGGPVSETATQSVVMTVTLQ